MAERTTPLTDSLAGRPLVYSNEQRELFRFNPAEFELRASLAELTRLYGPIRRLRLEGPLGWLVTEPERVVLDAGRSLSWKVRPGGLPTTCLPNLVLQIERADGGLSERLYAIPLELRGRTQFDPQRHALPLANAATDFGEVLPSQSVFDETYRRRPLAGRFFNGLYRDVVYLTGNPAVRRPGGLCTGIARSTLEFSLRQPDGEIGRQDTAMLRHRAMIWHGKQLADRALLASIVAWLTQGSAAAYRVFRRDVLSIGVVKLAMDVNVPRPWRRDLATSFIGNGHTVVPYAFRQTSDDRAEVWVYDPNYPQADEMRQSVIFFDLARNSYRYRGYEGTTAGRPSKVLAVQQEAYRAADTAYLSGAVSALVYQRDWQPAALVAVAASLLIGLLVSRLRLAPSRQPAPSRRRRWFGR